MRLLTLSPMLPALVLTVGCGSNHFKRDNTTVESPKTEQNSPDFSQENAQVIERSEAVVAQTMILGGKDAESTDQIVEDKEPEKGSKEADCLEHTINFDTDTKGQAIAAGTPIVGQYEAWGVTLSTINANHSGPQLGISFDSANPTGDDDDLKTPSDKDATGNDSALYNLLIIAENDLDENQDGKIDNPDDNAKGGKFIFTFSRPTKVLNLKLIDIEEDGALVKQKDSADQTFAEHEVKKLGDNTVQTIETKQDQYTSKLKVILPGSGAIDDIKICVSKEQKGKDETGKK